MRSGTNVNRYMNGVLAHTNTTDSGYSKFAGNYYKSLYTRRLYWSLPYQGKLSNVLLHDDTIYLNPAEANLPHFLTISDLLTSSLLDQTMLLPHQI